MVATRVETSVHQPAERFSIMPILHRKKKMCPTHKVIFLGRAGVGKSSLLAALCRTSPCAGVDFRVKMATVDGAVVKLQLWDTADQEKFGARTLPRSYFRNARAAVLVYDPANSESFRELVHWAAQLATLGDASEPLGLVLAAKRRRSMSCDVISNVAGRAMAALLGASFVECTSPAAVDVCMEQLVQVLSASTTWEADLRDVSAQLRAIEALVAAEKTDSEEGFVTESESEAETDEQTTKSLQPSLESSATFHCGRQHRSPSVSKVLARNRRDSKLFAALELGEAASASALASVSPRQLARGVLLGGCALASAAALALLLVQLHEGAVGLVGRMLFVCSSVML